MSKQKTNKLIQMSSNKLLLKLESDPDFFAFYLKEYSVLEKKSLSNVIKQLGLSSDRYRKLAFYRLDRQSVVKSCDSVANDLSLSSSVLLSLVRHVLAFEKMRSAPRSSDEPGLLMAARKKDKKR